MIRKGIRICRITIDGIIDQCKASRLHSDHIHLIVMDLTVFHAHEFQRFRPHFCTGEIDRHIGFCHIRNIMSGYFQITESIKPVAQNTSDLDLEGYGLLSAIVSDSAECDGSCSFVHVVFVICNDITYFRQIDFRFPEHDRNIIITQVYRRTDVFLVFDLEGHLGDVFTSFKDPVFCGCCSCVVSFACYCDCDLCSGLGISVYDIS